MDVDVERKIEGALAFNRSWGAEIDVATHLMKDKARDTREPVTRDTAF